MLFLLIHYNEFMEADQNAPVFYLRELRRMCVPNVPEPIMRFWSKVVPYIGNRVPFGMQSNNKHHKE
jgi:hypothetical protein